MRVPASEFSRWLDLKQLPVYQIMKRMRAEIGYVERKARLGIGTKWELPPQKLLEFDLSKVSAAEDVVSEVLKQDDSSSPACSPD
jgi:hypothetical protein